MLYWKNDGELLRKSIAVSEKAILAENPAATDLIDYNEYHMARQEKTKYTIIAAIVLFVIGLIFFSKLIIAFIFSLGGFFYPKYKVQDLITKRKAELQLQFKDALYSLTSSLGVGRSLESAFKTALNDLRVLYPDENTYIIKEFGYICRKIELNEPVETALLDFAERSGLEDIKNFAEVMVICKRTGGNLVQVVKNTSAILSDKIEISQEIELLFTKQKYEQKILNIMPIVFIGLVKFGGSGYMDSLYTSIKGYLLMALALGILIAASVVSKKIFDIKV
ncbi:type II secretion system F family protein [Thermincola ferriacetica]